MPLFSGFRIAHVKAHAVELADRLAKLYPPEIGQDPSRKVSAKRITRYLEDIAQEASEFGTQADLSWFQRAVFANEFNWKLREHGYDKAFIEVATEAVLVFITRQVKSAAGT